MRSSMKWMTAVAGTALAWPALASAAALANGDLVVYRVGDGVAALGGTTAAVFADEYTQTGTLVQSIALPTVTSGSQLALTSLGNANSEGFLSVSTDGKYVSVPGYNAATGVASATVTSTSMIVARSLGTITVATGAVDTSTGITDVGGNSRSSYTDGTNTYYAGSTGGYRGQTNGTNGASVNVSSTVTNNRAIRAFAGQLYATTGSGTTRVGSIGAGVSNTSGQTFTPFTGITSTQTTSPYAFFLADLSASVAGVDTLYLCDDAATTGGIQKYSLVGGTWVSNGKVGAVSTYRGLDAVVTATGVQLYATGSTAIYGLLDTTGYNATITATPATIVTAPTSEVFRGIAFVPEPTTATALGAGVALVARRRRQSR